MSSRFFINTNLAKIFADKLPLTVADELFHYIINVRRFRILQEIVLFNGDGNEYHAKIITINKKNINLEILNCLNINRESQVKINLYLSFIANDKFDFAIQKSVELGVSEITPVISEYSQKLPATVFEKKLQHWQGIMISACEQCGRNSLPVIYHPILITSLPRLNNFIVADFAGENLEKVIKTLDKKLPINILIGPEGGFSASEQKLFDTLNFIKINLGKRTFRAETAAIFLISKLICD